MSTYQRAEFGDIKHTTCLMIPQTTSFWSPSHHFVSTTNQQGSKGRSLLRSGLIRETVGIQLACVSSRLDKLTKQWTEEISSKFNADISTTKIAKDFQCPG